MIMPRDAPASTRASAKYTPYIHLSSHLIFYPSLHPSYLRRHRNGSQQRTVARTRRPSPEPVDRRQNQSTVARSRRQPFERPASEHHERFNRSIESNQSLNISPSPNRIELRPPREAPQTTTVQTYSQRTPIKNDSNQSINQINTINRSIQSGRAFDRAD